MGFKKEDIEYHYNGRHKVPAVNVKVYKSTWQLPLPFAYACTMEDDKIVNHMTDPQFTHDWIEEHVDDELGNAYFDSVCEAGWECLQEYAEELFGKGVKVYSAGRSGGWAYIHHITADHVEEWDAIELNKWARFSKFAKSVAEHVPETMLHDIYNNQFIPWEEETHKGTMKVDAI